MRTTGRWPIRFGRIFGCRYFPERDFILTDFLRDGDKDASAAIARAIQACHNAGGGWVVVPAGEFRCGPVHLRYGVNFHLPPAPFWLLNPVLCEHVTVRGVHLQSLGPNSDGCNLESCRNVLIENCFFDTGDDCIAIKSGRNADGRRIGVASENIVIRGCQMRAGHGALYSVARSLAVRGISLRKTADLQGAAIFLASGASNFVTGQIVYVDGGILAMIGRPRGE